MKSWTYQSYVELGEEGFFVVAPELAIVEWGMSVDEAASIARQRLIHTLAELSWEVPLGPPPDFLLTNPPDTIKLPLTMTLGEVINAGGK